MAGRAMGGAAGRVGGALRRLAPKAVTWGAWWVATWSTWATWATWAAWAAWAAGCAAGPSRAGALGEAQVLAGVGAGATPRAIGGDEAKVDETGRPRGDVERASVEQASVAMSGGAAGGGREAGARHDEGRVQALRAAIDEVLGRPELRWARVGALVVDVVGGEVLYERGADAALIPASNEKLLTTGAAFGLLGPGHVAVTRVWANAAPDARGEVGSLTLVGVLDPTWQRGFHDDAGEPLERLAERVRASGVTRVRGAVVVAGEPLIALERAKALDVREHRQRVVGRWRRALERAGVRVARVTASSEAWAAAPGAIEVAAWSSPPLSASATIVNQASHNEMADALLRQIGLVRRGQGEAGEAEALAYFAASGVPVAGLRMADGSGLSRDDRASARALVALLTHARAQPWGEAFVATLAVAGEKGTLARRQRHVDTAGRVRAKTGTLREVVSLSGYVDNRHDGRTYAFSMLFNGVQQGDAARLAEDAVVARLAGPWSLVR